MEDQKLLRFFDCDELQKISETSSPRERLTTRIERGILDDPTENAAWIGLARYQLLVGKPHPVTVGIARMHPEDLDTIDDFLLEIATRGLALKRQRLSHLIRRSIAGDATPTAQEVESLVPEKFLRIAREWRKHPERVLARLATREE